MTIRRLIRIENGLGFAACIYAFIQLDYSLWIFFLFLLVPDITMLGYALNPQTGAVIYNWGHSFILPALLGASYLLFPADILLMVSIIWIAHIFVDRLFGFGLKYEESFNATHVQRL